MFMKFHHLKPWFAKHLKEWNTYYHKYHTKFNDLRLGFNAMKAMEKDVHKQYACSSEGVCRLEVNSGCASEVNCVAHIQTYDTFTSLLSSIL
jgi:hypothetical protein